jgi:undecaprenyl-diphosphatase
MFISHFLISFYSIIHEFDRIIIQFIIDHFSHSKEMFYDIFFLSGDHLFKGGMMIAFLWFAWYKREDEIDSEIDKKHIYLVATLLAAIFAMVISRSLTAILPFNQRPLFDLSFHYFDFPMEKYGFDKLSSFPSDHAVLFISIATGLLLVSRKIGLIAYAYVLLVILFPRIYLGYHWPSDIIAGALIGAGVTTLFIKSDWIISLISKFTLPLIHKKPALFYALFFLVSYQIADMFDASRAFAGFVKHFVVK